MTESLIAKYEKMREYAVRRTLFMQELGIRDLAEESALAERMALLSIVVHDLKNLHMSQKLIAKVDAEVQQ